MFFPSTLDRPVSDAFEDFRCLSSYPLDQVGSGNFFRGEIYNWLKKGILLMWINFLHSLPEVLHGASCAKTHFIHCLGSSCQANIQSNSTLLQPRVCLLSETVSRERSESCYITIPGTLQQTTVDNTHQVHQGIMSEIYPLADKFDLSPRLKQNGERKSRMKTQIVFFWL